MCCIGQSQEAQRPSSSLANGGCPKHHGRAGSKLSIEDCLAIAKVQVEHMRERGVVEAVREIHDLHSTKVRQFRTSDRRPRVCL